MKVGTDGALLGAWAQGGARILDVGTGTGVVALMMAQRFPNAWVTAIDIDDTKLGIVAAQTLLKLIRGKPVQNQYLRNYQIILRESTT